MWKCRKYADKGDMKTVSSGLNFGAMFSSQVLYKQ